MEAFVLELAADIETVRQTKKQTEPNILTPTDSVGEGRNKKLE